MGIYKICGRCGKKIESGTTCACLKKRHKEYDRTSRDKESKAFYNSTSWIKVKKHVLERDEIDVYLYMTEGIEVAADTVHHIIPLKDDRSRGLDCKNLMSLHHGTHSKIEQMYKKDKIATIKELDRIQREYLRGRGV